MFKETAKMGEKKSNEIFKALKNEEVLKLIICYPLSLWYYLQIN